MKIEEVIKIYEFLGNLNLWGFIAFYFLFIIAIFAVIIPLKEKITTTTNNIKTVNSTLIAIGIIISVALAILYWQAQYRIVLIQAGNFIKQDFAYSSYRQKSFKNVSLPYNISENEKSEVLMNLIHEFPNDFTLVKLGDSGVKGINIIEMKTVAMINKSIEQKAISTASLIVKYMYANDINSISIDEISRINYDAFLIGQDFFKVIIGKSDLFPIYDNNFSIIGFKLIKHDKADFTFSNIKEGEIIKENKITIQGHLKALSKGNFLYGMLRLNSGYNVMAIPAKIDRDGNWNCDFFIGDNLGQLKICMVECNEKSNKQLQQNFANKDWSLSNLLDGMNELACIAVSKP